MSLCGRVDGLCRGSGKGSGKQFPPVGTESAEGRTPSWWISIACLREESQRKLNSVKAFTGGGGSLSQLQAE